MATLTESGKISDIIANEFDPRIQRDMLTAKGAIVFGNVIKDGDDATEGEAVVAAGTSAKGIALADAEDGEEFPALLWGPALVKNSGIVYHDDATDNQKVSTRALLFARGIRVDINCI